MNNNPSAKSNKELKGEENNPYEKFRFKDFTELLGRYDTLNSAEIDEKDRLLIMKAIVKKAELDKEIGLIWTSVVPPLFQLTGQEHIYIEQLCKTLKKIEGNLVGEYTTWTISPDWTVVRGTLPYQVACSVLPT